MAKTKTPPAGEESSKEGEAWEKPLPNGNVRRSVLVALGRPPGLYEVAVRSLWENHYRVNVLVGTDATTVRIAHSYFVKAAENGDIVTSTPSIKKLYT